MLRAYGSLLLIGALVGLLGGCKENVSKEPENLPSIPKLELGLLSEDARQAMREAYDRAMQYPGDALSNGELGMQFHANQRYAEAAVMYDRARKIHGVFRWEYYRGVVLSEAGDVAEATASFKRALALNENDPNALQSLAQHYFKHAASDPSLEAEGDRTVDLLIRTHPESPQGPLLRAARLEETGKTQEAIEAYRQMIEKGQSFGVLHTSLARLYTQAGDTQKARRHEALAQQSERPFPPNQNRWLAAINQLGISNLANSARGQIYYQNRMLEPAAQEFELAVQSEPANVTHRINLVAIYGMLQQEEKARQHYQAALRMGGADAKVHLNMATLLLAKGNADEAEQIFLRALAADGSLGKAQLGLARVALQRGDQKRAESYIRQAIILEPLNPVNYWELGRVLRSQGRVDEAIRAIEEGVSYSEGRMAVELLRLLAQLHYDQADQVAAMGALGRARVEAERSGSSVDLALIDAQLASFRTRQGGSAAP